MKYAVRLLNLIILMGTIAFSGCKNDPAPTNQPEIITRAILTFTPLSGPTITMGATDPDLNGIKPLTPDGPINLIVGTTYVLSFQFYNDQFVPGNTGYDVKAQIVDEAEVHQIFFSWSAGIFSSPTGDGNIDNRDDPLTYGTSVDKAGNPVGLFTTWTTAASASTGANTFRVLLKHQPGVKSATTTASDGSSDLDLTFTININ